VLDNEEIYPDNRVIILVTRISLIEFVRLGAGSNVNKMETFSQLRAGEYVSSELVLSEHSVVASKSPASDGGLVPFLAV
jgi:hypothetical protein